MGEQVMKALKRLVWTCRLFSGASGAHVDRRIWSCAPHENEAAKAEMAQLVRLSVTRYRMIRELEELSSATMLHLLSAPEHAPGLHVRPLSPYLSAPCTSVSLCCRCSPNSRARRRVMPLG